MYWASASLAGNFPASQSNEYCLLSAAASHRRKSCNSPLASFPMSSRVRWEGKLRGIFAPPSSPCSTLDQNKEQLIGWEANDEIAHKRTLLVKGSVSEQGNQRARCPRRRRQAATIFSGRGCRDCYAILLVLVWTCPASALIRSHQCGPGNVRHSLPTTGSK